MRWGVVLGVSFAIGAWWAPDAIAAAANPVTATPVSATEGQQFSGQVGTLSSCSQSDTMDTVTINWGDGQASSGAVMSPAVGTNQCEITGTHTYAEERSYPTKVTVVEFATGASFSGTSTATVADAPISLTARSLSGTAGSSTSSTLATLQDSGGLEPPADYTVAIDWGDGQTSAGAVDTAGNVSGSHTYAAAGSYSATVTVADDGGQSAHTTAAVSISSPSPPPSPPPCVPTTPTAPPPFTPTAASPDARWVQALYNDLLARPADMAGLDAFTAALGAGATRAQVVADIESSPERTAVIVDSLFNQYLHRSPDSMELNAFEAFLTGGGTDEQLAATLLGSPEYLATRGGGTTQGFLGALYCDVLNRSIDPAALLSWEQALGAGTTRQQVAEAVLSSTEYRSDLVEGLFLRFLRRPPSAADRAYWLTQLGAGVTDEQLITAFVSSQEYFNDFSGPGATLLNPAISRLGVIHLTLVKPATIQLVVLQLLPAVQHQAPTAAAGSAPVVPVPRTRLLGTVSFGRHRKGRVTIHWNRQVGKHRLKRGRYLLLLETRSGGKLRDVSDAITVALR